VSENPSATHSPDADKCAMQPSPNEAYVVAFRRAPADLLSHATTFEFWSSAFELIRDILCDMSSKRPSQSALVNLLAGYSRPALSQFDIWSAFAQD
jgi:hypothetical protein